MALSSISLRLLCPPIHPQFGNIAVVRLLLERGHPVNVFAHEEPRTPLHMAVLEGHTEVVDLLLQHGASFAGAPLVHVAAEVGDPALVRSLLAAPEGCGQVAALDQFHACPLHWAAKHGHLEVAQALVQADPAAAATSWWVGLVAWDGHELVAMQGRAEELLQCFSPCAPA